jgi:hypothetical protein
MVCIILGHGIDWVCIGQNAMSRAQVLVAYFCALSALTLGAHAQLTASAARKLRSWATSDYLIHGQSPEARIGSPIVALNGAIYLFGGATALGECRACVSAHRWGAEGDGGGEGGGEREREGEGGTVQPPSDGAPAAGALNDVWRFDPRVPSWTAIPARGAPPSARSRHALASSRRHIYMFGGFRGRDSGKGPR